MKSKKEIVFVLPSLMAGGAERVMAFVANNLNTEYFNVKLLIIGFEKDAVYEFDSEKIVFLNKARISNAIFDVFRLLKTHKPDIVVSSISHLNVLMAFFSFFLYNTKFIGRESSVISYMKEYSSVKFKINYWLIKFSYKFLDRIICQSTDMFDDFVNNIKIDKRKLILIHNPITKKEPLNVMRQLNNNVKFVTVGRLNEVKGHLRILEALSQVKNKNFEYTIIGSGPSEGLIKNEVLRLNLSKHVFFINQTKQIYEQLRKHDFFLQGSFVEGFPNGLLEAMSIGIPAIAFEAPGGTKEIIINNVNGFIVKDVKELVSIIDKDDLLDNFDKEKIRLSVESRFSSDVIIKKYEDLLLNV